LPSTGSEHAEQAVQNKIPCSIWQRQPCRMQLQYLLNYSLHDVCGPSWSSPRRQNLVPRYPRTPQVPRDATKLDLYVTGVLVHGPAPAVLPWQFHKRSTPFDTCRPIMIGLGAASSLLRRPHAFKPRKIPCHMCAPSTSARVQYCQGNPHVMQKRSTSPFHCPGAGIVTVDASEPAIATL